MARNCAVIIGINDYDEIQPLNFAKSDAERMRDYFQGDLGVEPTDLYFFSDDSPRNAQGRKTQPTYGTLKSFLTDRFETSFLKDGDTLWFYFSGHGMPWEGRDYLLPSDGNPRSAPDLAIPIADITDRLRRSGADNVVMLIDACRSDGAKDAGLGIGAEEQQGVITFYSCSPAQVSYEIEALQQGAFTYVLLEALRIQGEGNCATVKRFSHYLRDRVPKLTQKYKNYPQTPYITYEPDTKSHYILLPKFANLTDIDPLKNAALHAEVEGDLDLAFQLWMRVNVAAGGTDMQAINAFQRLATKQLQKNELQGIDYRELPNEKQWQRKYEQWSTWMDELRSHYKNPLKPANVEQQIQAALERSYSNRWNFIKAKIQGKKGLRNFGLKDFSVRNAHYQFDWAQYPKIFAGNVLKGNSIPQDKEQEVIREIENLKHNLFEDVDKILREKENNSEPYNESYITDILTHISSATKEKSEKLFKNAAFRLTPDLEIDLVISICGSLIQRLEKLDENFRKQAWSSHEKILNLFNRNQHILNDKKEKI